MTPLLHLDHITRHFGGLAALQPLSLDIPAGTRHAIIGPNGAGKSTLLSLIAGTLHPSAGRILLNGRNITRLRPAARARLGISRTWQHPAIFAHLTVADNLTLAGHRAATPQPDFDDASMGRWLQMLSPADSAAAVPAGALPYGHQRRLELAMALARQPRLLLLDEPSAGLDADDLAALSATLRALPTSVTVVLVDHHLDLVWSVADTVTVLHHGQHLATGTPDQVRADPGVQRAYLRAGEHPVPRQTRHSEAPAAMLLQIRNLTTGHTETPVLAGIDLDLPAGQITAILGRNGAGKTTLLNTIMGLHPAWPPTTITLDQQQLASGRPEAAARAGLGFVPQGRRLFAALTVAEHLRLAEAAGQSRERRRSQPGQSDPTDRPSGRSSSPGTWTRSRVLDLLPDLAHRLHHRADRLSGGEQQQLALARALLTRPRILLLDEPSEGLAPILAADLMGVLRDLADDGLTILLAEQHLPLALGTANQVHVLVSGTLTARCGTDDLPETGRWRPWCTLLGIGDGRDPG